MHTGLAIIYTDQSLSLSSPGNFYRKKYCFLTSPFVLSPVKFSLTTITTRLTLFCPVQWAS